MNDTQYQELKQQILTLRRLIVQITGGSSGAPAAHAASHSDGGTDEIDITDLGGYPGGTTSFLRADASFATPSAGSVGDLLDWQFIPKTGEESVNSGGTGTTLQADDHLLFAIGANQSWEFELVLNYTGTEAIDIKFSFQGPSGCAGQWSGLGPIEVSAAGTRDFVTFSRTVWDNSLPAVFGCVSTGRTSGLIKGYARNGATPGNIALFWAQQASSATNLTVHTDSYIVARRVL